MADDTVKSELDTLETDIAAAGTVKSFHLNGISVTNEDRNQLEDLRDRLEKKVARKHARKRTRPDFS